LKNYEFAFSKCSAFASLGFVRFSLHTSAGFVGKEPVIFLPLSSGNFTTLRVHHLQPTLKNLLALYFNDLNVELSNIKCHRKQTFIEVELKQVFRINCMFIRESTIT